MSSMLLARAHVMLPLLLLLSTQPSVGVQPPNVSLATMPVGYFGGHHNKDTIFHGNTSCPATGCRPAQNIAMLSKMRLVRLPCLFGQPCIQPTPIWLLLTVLRASACTCMGNRS